MKIKIILLLVCFLFLCSFNANANSKEEQSESKRNFCGTSSLIDMAHKKWSERKKEAMTASFYDYKILNKEKQEIPMSKFKGNVVLIVNTECLPSRYDFSSQYVALETMYRKYHDQGFEIIAVPCGQFDNITQFIAKYTDKSRRYNTTFTQVENSKVNGLYELPIYTFLKQKKGFTGFDEDDSKMAKLLHTNLKMMNPKYEKESDIKWYFTKFVIDQNGNVIERFEPTTDMNKVEKCVSDLLKK